MHPDSNWPMPIQDGPHRTGNVSWAEVGRHLNFTYNELKQQSEIEYEWERIQRNTLQAINLAEEPRFDIVSIVTGMVAILSVVVWAWCLYRYVPVAAKDLYYLLNQK